MQERWVQSLVWKDPACWRTTKPMCHIYWARDLELMIAATEPCTATTEPVIHKKRSHRNKPVHLNWKVAPLSATREKAHAAMKTKQSQK